MTNIKHLKHTMVLLIIWILSPMVLATNTNLSGCCQVPQSFNFQAEVILDGSPANGQFEVIFYLYDQEFPSGGMNGFPVDFDNQVITIEDGLLETELTFDDSTFRFSQMWLEIVIVDPFGQGEVTLQPRTSINTVPIALVAKSVINGSIDSGAIKTNSIITSKIANQAIINAKIKDQDITLNKLAPHGASSGDIIQFNGQTWQANSNVATQWTNTNDGISYNNGKVGVGTNVPTGLFHIQGDGNDELSLYGINSTPFIHFRRLNGNVDWVLKQSDNGTQFHIQTEVSDNNEIFSLTSSGRVGINTASPNGYFDLRDSGGELLLNINQDGSINRKPQTKEIYLSYKSFTPEDSDYSYDTLNFLGLNGFRSTFGNSESITLHTDVHLPASAVVTKFEVLAGDNSADGGITAQLGYRLFGTSNGVINISTLTSNNSPFSEVLSDNLNTTVNTNRTYFIKVSIDDALQNGQEIIFAGARITYELSDF